MMEGDDSSGQHATSRPPLVAEAKALQQQAVCTALGRVGGQRDPGTVLTD